MDKKDTKLMVSIEKKRGLPLYQDHLRVKGSIWGITKITKPFKKRNYIEIIKNEAEFFIENGITNPEEYYKNR